MRKHIADCLVPDALSGDFEPRAAGLCDAVSLNSVFTGTDSIIRDVVATADADTTATIPHGLGVAPQEVTITQLISQGLTALSAWAVTTIDATNVVCTKLTSTGSGNASPQLRVLIRRPHTIGR